MIFRDRLDAGHRLAAQLGSYAQRQDVLVLALPRGGVPVAFEVAQALRAPLDIVVVRKLGAPGQPEFAIGALASGGIELISPAARRLHIPPAQIEMIAAREREELARREIAYRGNRPPAVVAGKTVILVDDGLATGATMRAAIASVRQRGPASIVVAVPVGAASVCDDVAAEADAVICLHTPVDLDAVGQWYEDFSQTTDDEVQDLLTRSQGSVESAPR